MTGTADGGLDPLERGQVAVGGAHERLDRREVVERLGEVLGALLERAVELDLLGQDLLLEQRRQDDRADAGALEPPGHGRLRVVRRGRGDDRRAELEPEVAGARGRRSCPSSFAVVAIARVALDLGHDLRVGSMDVRDRALDAGELLVVAPALVGVGLRQRRELGGAFRMRPLEDGEARLGRRRSRRSGSTASIESSLNGLPPSISDGWKRYSGQ